MEKSHIKNTAIEVFAGCGGLTEGIKQAGFEVLAAIELDKTAAKTYECNHPNVNLMVQDVRTIKGDDLLKKTGLKVGELSLLAGCAPCQGFSRLQKKDEFCSDIRNGLILQFVRLVEELKPKTIMMENVPGLINSEQGKAIFSIAEKKLKDLGYKIDFNIVDMANYGVPQFRRRFVLLGSRTDIVKIPDSTHISPNLKKLNPDKEYWCTMRDTIMDVPPIGNGEKHPNIPTHFATKNKELNLERIKNIPKNGGSRKDLPEHLQLKCHKRYPNGFKDVYGRMTWEKPSPTLTGGCTNITKGRFIHPEQDRAITLFEASLIQTFRRNYVFHGNAGDMALQIGNAVPPRFGYVMTKTLYDSLTIKIKESKPRK